MSEFNDFAQRIQQFLETDGSDVKTLAKDLTESKLTHEQIMGLLWTFLSLSKSASLFNENSANLICMILYEIAEINSDFTNLLYITLDKADLDRINVDSTLIDKVNFNKSLRICTSKKYNITKYQYMDKNPEGFACLLLALMKNRADDLVQIIGEHNLDPDSVLLILIDLIGFKNEEGTKKFYNMLPQFDVNRTINMLVKKIDENYMPGHIRILFYLFDSGMIPIEKQISILSHLSSVLEKLQSLLSEATDDFCKYIRKARTIFPGEPKHSSEWEKLHKAYLEARDTLYKSPYFRIEFSEIEIDKIFKYAKYDPCSIPKLAEYVTNYLLESLEEDPENFFQNETNMLLIPILSCHCTSNKLIAKICQLNEIPAHVFVNLILPVMSMSNCGWQLSEKIYDKMSSLFTFSERCQIYRRLDSVYSVLPELRIISASAQGKIANIKKRMTTSNNQNSYKFSKFIIKAPHVASNELISYIKTNKPTPPVDVLIRVLCDSSRFAIDIIFWRFTDAVENIKYNSKSELEMLPPTFTLWPKYISQFLGKLALDNFYSFDLSGYLNFIIKGLKQQKISHVCLFSHLLSEITGISYNAQMTESDIEIYSGESLYQTMQYIESKNKNQQIRDSFKEMLLSEENNFALDIFCSLDSMHCSLKFIDVFPDTNIARDRVDDIQSTFLSLCEFLESNNWSATELVTKYHFSYPSAFHISRENSEIEGSDIETLMPEKIPSDLFASFWKYGLKDLHYPDEKFKETIQKIDDVIQKETKDGKPETEIQQFKEILENVKDNAAKQEQKIIDIRDELNSICQDWFNEDLNEDIYLRFAHFCVMKRIIISKLDPIYSANFVFLLAHLQNSQFDLMKFVLVFLSKIHFIIMSRTVTESNLFGAFIKNILMYFDDQGDIKEIIDVHSYLMQKIAILFERKETMFITVNVINFLNTIQDYFPKRTEHKNFILDQLKLIELPDGSDVKLLVKRYSSNVEKLLKDKNPSRPVSPPPIKSIPALNKQSEEIENVNDEKNEEQTEKVNTDADATNDEERKEEESENENENENDGADLTNNEEEQINEHDEEEEKEAHKSNDDENNEGHASSANNEEEQINEHYEEEDHENNDDEKHASTTNNEEEQENENNENSNDESSKHYDDDRSNDNENENEEENVNENENDVDEQKRTDDDNGENNEANEEEQQNESDIKIEKLKKAIAEAESQEEKANRNSSVDKSKADENQKSEEKKDRSNRNDRNDRNDRAPRPLSKQMTPSHQTSRDRSDRGGPNDGRDRMRVIRNNQNDKGRYNRNDGMNRDRDRNDGMNRDRDRGRDRNDGMNRDRDRGRDRNDGMGRDRDRNDGYQQYRMRSQSSDMYSSQNMSDYKNYNFRSPSRPNNRSNYNDPRRRNSDK